MTRSSNGLTMSGSGFKGNYWRKQSRGHGPKSPWMAYVPVSELFLVKRYVGSYFAGPAILGEPEFCFKPIGTFRLPEILEKIESKELSNLDYVRQEDDVGWVNALEFASRMRPRKKRPKANSKKSNKKQPKKKRLGKASNTPGKRKPLVKSKARRSSSK